MVNCPLRRLPRLCSAMQKIKVSSSVPYPVWVRPGFGQCYGAMGVKCSVLGREVDRLLAQVFKTGVGRFINDNLNSVGGEAGWERESEYILH